MTATTSFSRLVLKPIPLVIPAKAGIQYSPRPLGFSTSDPTAYWIPVLSLVRQTGMTSNVGMAGSKLDFLFGLAQVGWALKWIEIRFLVKRDRESEISASHPLHAGLKSFSVSLNVSCDSSNA